MYEPGEDQYVSMRWLVWVEDLEGAGISQERVGVC